MLEGETNALSRRLIEHADTIRATSLKIEDFSCRYLVVDDIWIPLGESLLIANFRPLWNTRIDGFGNHDPGSGRYEQKRSRWDELHPGRAWAVKCRERPETVNHIRQDVIQYLTSATFENVALPLLLTPGPESSPGPVVSSKPARSGKPKRPPSKK